MEIQAAAADEVHDADVDMAAFVDPPAPAGGTARVIGGPQEVGILIQPICDLLFAEGVVPQGHHISPGGVEGLHLIGEDPHTGGILPVDHGKVDILEPFETAQVPLQVFEPRLPHHVSDSQNPIEHMCRPSPILSKVV